MSKCVIIGGARINNYERVKKYIDADDLIIYCDCGLAHKDKLSIEPNIVIGDFDSYKKPELDCEIIVLPTEKDDTDTAYALKVGLKRMYTQFLFIGVIGERFDHSLGNMSLLLKLDCLGISGTVIDDYSLMKIISNKTEFIDDDCAYFSLLAVDGNAYGVNIKNAKYELDNATITSDCQYGISNEVLNGNTAEVSVKDGRLLLIKIFK